MHPYLLDTMAIHHLADRDRAARRRMVRDRAGRRGVHSFLRGIWTRRRGRRDAPAVPALAVAPVLAVMPARRGRDAAPGPPRTRDRARSPAAHGRRAPFDARRAARLQPRGVLIPARPRPLTRLPPMTTATVLRTDPKPAIARTIAPQPQIPLLPWLFVRAAAAHARAATTGRS